MLIQKIQRYLKEKGRDGLLIYEIDGLEPYFKEITGIHSANSVLFYIPKEDKPKCIVLPTDVETIRSTGLFEEKNILECTDVPFRTVVKPFIESLKGKKVLANFSETDPFIDQLPHSFFQGYLQDLILDSSEKLWKSIGIEIKDKKEYLFTTSFEVRKKRVEDFKNKISASYSFLMVNGVDKAASETYASYLLGFLKNQKYAVAVKPEEVTVIVHKDETLKEHPFDRVITYKNIREFKRIISEYFKDIKHVEYDDMTEGNYRLIKKILDNKLEGGGNLLVEEALSVKLPEEIREMKKACMINDKIFDYLEERLKTGMSEKEVLNLIKEKALSYPEVLGLFFDPLVAAGENSSDIHHESTDYKIQKDDLLLIDIGVKLKTGMGSDTTCMYYFGDSIPDRIKKYNKVMDKSISSAVKNIAPGKKKISADFAARREISKNYPEYDHGTGHGVDIKCHGSSEPIKKYPTGFFGVGEVMTIEPGIYITKDKASKKYTKVEGFRKEIMIHVTEKGVKKLNEIPKLRLIKS